MRIDDMVSKEISFCYAHRLVHGYPEACRCVHGHNAITKIVLVSTGKLNQYGFVKDFNDVKKVKQWIDENWDHGALVSSDDKIWSDWLREQKQKYYVIPHNPTSELMAKELFKVASLLLNDGYAKVTEVSIGETCTSAATHSERNCSCC